MSVTKPVEGRYTRIVGVLRLIIAFGAVPALSLATPLVVVPVIARYYGGDGIVAVSVGQSVGAVAGIVVALAWPLIGPAAVARADGPTRQQLYVASLRSRYVVLAAITLPAAATAAVLVNSHRLESAGCAVAVAGYGLTASWYYSGTGDGTGLVRYEALPRVAASALSGLLILGGAPLMTYPVLLILSVVITNYLNSLRILGKPHPRIGFRDVGLRDQVSVTASRLVNGLYSAGAVSVVSAVAPAASLLFASCDRVQKPLLNASAALPQALLSLIVGPGGSSRSRLNQVLLANALFAIAIGISFYAAFPYLMRVLYSDVVTPSTALALATATGLGIGAFARALLSNGLLAVQDDRFATQSLLVVSGVGLVGIVVGAVTSGALGALWAFAAAELGFVLIAGVRLVVLGVRDES